MIDLSKLDEIAERAYFDDDTPHGIRVKCWELHSALVQGGVIRAWEVGQSGTKRDTVGQNATGAD